MAQKTTKLPNYLSLFCLVLWAPLAIYIFLFIQEFIPNFSLPQGFLDSNQPY